MRRQLHAFTLCAICILGASCLTGPIFAATNEDERVSALEQKLDQSLKLIDQLAARVKELEAQSAAKTASAQGVQLAPPAAPPAAPAAAQAAVVPAPAAAPQAEASSLTLQRLDSVEQQLAQMSDPSAGHGGMGVPLHGFADIGIGNHTADEPNFQGANLGALDIFLNPQLGEHTRALFELTFEADETGQVTSDLERAQIGYQFNDAATVWVGRFHTPFGYYNTAFHHGQQIATSLRRPRFLLFEDQGGIMPSHTVGAWFTGAEPFSGGKATYDLFIGNGQSIDGGEINPRSGGVDHGGAIYGGNLGYVFGETLNGLKVGLSAFRAKITDDQLYLNFIQVNNVGAYFAYDTDHVEYLGEYYRFSDSNITPTSPLHRSHVGFVQLAWRLPIATPYVRYERGVLDQSDQYFAAQNEGMSYYRGAAGLRFDIDLKSALKFELARTKNTDRNVDQWTDVLMDYAIRF